MHVFLGRDNNLAMLLRFVRDRRFNKHLFRYPEQSSIRLVEISSFFLASPLFVLPAQLLTKFALGI